MSHHENREQVPQRAHQSDAASGMVNYGLENLQNQHARTDFLHYLQAVRYDQMPAAERGRIDGMLAAQRNLNNTLYKYNYEAGKIEAGAQQLETALKDLARIFSAAPDSVWGTPAAQRPQRKAAAVKRIRSVARDIANDPEEAKRIADAARKAKEEQEAAAKAAAEARIKSIETAGLNQNQASLLSSPKLKITTIIKKVQAQRQLPASPTPEQKVAHNKAQMIAFKGFLTTAMVGRVNEWVKNNKQFAQGAESGEESLVRKEAWKQSDLPGHMETSLVGDTGHLLKSGFLGLTGNIPGLSSNADLGSGFPADLDAIFESSEEYKQLFGLLSEDGKVNQSGIEALVKSKIDKLFPEGTSFTGVEQMFAAYNKPNDQLTEEDLNDIIGRLQRIPKYFRHFQPDLVEQYETYLRTEAAGPGAIEFEEWVMSSENLGMFQSLIFSLVFKFPGIADFLVNFFDGSESEKTDAQKRGATLNKYMDLREEVAPAANTGPQKALIESIHYKNLLKAFNKARPGATPLDLKVDGKPLDQVSSSDLAQMETDLASITSFLEKRPQAYSLLTKGAELKDTAYLVETLNALGTDVEFGANGVEVNLENVLLNNFGVQDAVAIGGGTVAGYKANKWLMNKNLAKNSTQGFIKNGARAAGRGVQSFAKGASRFGWRGKAVGLALMSGSSWLIDEGLDFFTGKSLKLSYDQLNPANIHYISSIIKEAKGDITPPQAEKENLDFYNQSFANRLAPGADLASLIEDSGNFPHSFSSLMGLSPSFWGAYKMTAADIKAFQSNKDGWTGLTGSMNNDFNAFEEKSNGKFEVNGSHALWDKEFPSVEKFFEWLRK